MINKTDVHKLPSGNDLISQCLAGDRSAKEALAKACIPRVRKTVVLAIGNSQDVDDLVQTTLVRVLLGLRSFQGRAEFNTWLDKVTVNTVRQYFRRRSFLLFFQPTELLPAESNELENPERQLQGQRLLEKLSYHLSFIRPKKRIALILNAAFGYTAPEIAEITGCTPDTAKKRLQHGRREMLSRINHDLCLKQIIRETR